MNWLDVSMSFWKAWSSPLFGALFKVLILNLVVVMILFIILSLK